MKALHLVTLRVVHAFHGEGIDCPALMPVLCDAALAERHRLIVRAAPGRIALHAPVAADGQPWFGLPDPPALRFALVMVDPIVEAVTELPSGTRVERPDGLLGVGRRSMPLYVFGPDAVAPTVELVFVAAGPIRVERSSSGPVGLVVADRRGVEVERALLAPAPESGSVSRIVELSARGPGPWWVRVDGVTHAIHAGRLPTGCLALVCIELPVPATPSDEERVCTVELSVARAPWLYHVVLDPREPASEGVSYAIEASAEVDRHPVTMQRAPGFDARVLVFASTEAVPASLRPLPPLSLYRDDPTSRRVLVERLPIPSPRALGAPVIVHL